MGKSRRLDPGFLVSGAWKADLRDLVLTHIDAPWYEVDLEKMTSCPELLDLIFQLWGKTWCSRQDVGDLIEILNRLLDPQGCLCSSGSEQGQIVVRDVIRKNTGGPQQPDLLSPRFR